MRIQEEFNLDLFVSLNGKRLADLLPWIAYHTLKSGTQIPFLKAEALIETKKGSAREKDRADIGALTDIFRAQNDNPAPPQDFKLDSVRSEAVSEENPPL
ncbi:MAG TPA: hypothetical protein VGC39_01825 [Candidatus Methylacidiphilales bacterium]